MSVRFSPDYSRTNPYQRLLSDALEDGGTDVEPVPRHDAFMPLAALRGGLPEVLHVHWIHPFAIGRYRVVTLLKGALFLLQLTLLRALGVRLVWTVHNVLEHDPRTPVAERVVRHLLARTVDAMVVHCADATDTLIEAYRLPDRLRDRIDVVPHGHYIDVYENEVSRESARAELGLDDEFLFLFFGRVCGYKNVPGLVEAFRGLDGDGVRLVVAGNPDGTGVGDAVRTAAAGDDRVRLDLEFVPTDRIQVYMNAADVVVLPFETILMSGSVVTTMSFGRPVIVPDEGCVASLLPADGGFSYDGSGTDALRAAMRRAMHADLETVGRANYRAMETYTWDLVADRTRSVYEGTAPERPPVVASG